MARTFGGAASDQITTGLVSNVTQRSVCIWTKRNGDGGGNLGWMSGKGFDEIIYNNAAGGTYDVLFDASTNGGIWAITRPSTGVWKAFGWSFDFSSTANNPKMYLDGVSQTVTETSTPAGTFSTSSNPYCIGNSGVLGTRNWDGALAWHCIWNAILTDAEFLAFANGVRPDRIRPAALVSCFPLWGLHSPEIDLSANHDTGTVTGTTFANGPPVTLFTPKVPSFLDVQAFNPVWSARNNILTGGGLV